MSHWDPQHAFFTNHTQGFNEFVWLLINKIIRYEWSSEIKESFSQNHSQNLINLLHRICNSCTSWKRKICLTYGCWPLAMRSKQWRKQFTQLNTQPLATIYNFHTSLWQRTHVPRCHCVKWTLKWFQWTNKDDNLLHLECMRSNLFHLPAK